MNISACKFDKNNASAGGGAIYNLNYVNISAFNCNFTNNRAGTWGGGAIDNSNMSKLIISNCNFINNSVIGNLSGTGGAINNGASSSLNVSSSNFTNNTATSNNGSYGGAIVSTGGTNLTVAGCNFFNNSANMGGAVYYAGNNVIVSISGSNLFNNNATYGGAIYGSIPGSDVNNCTFTNNNATYGGAIYNGNSATMRVSNCNFFNNNGSYGGGIYNSLMAYLTVVDSIFSGNSAFYGGGIFTNGNGLYVNGSVFTNNTQAIGIQYPNHILNNNTITNNTIAIQFILDDRNYTISSLSANNNIRDNLFAIGISGTGSNYTVRDSFGSQNNGGFIFTASNNSIVNSNISGYRRADSWAILLNTSLNSVISCNITNNDRGIGIYGRENRVIGCNIFNNNLGIHILPGGFSLYNVINYNRIFNNTNSTGFDLINNGNYTNADLNWWGSNNPLVNGITLANWFVMQLSANNFKTIVNATTNQPIGIVELTYDFLLYNVNGTTSPFIDNGLLPNFMINLIWNGTSGIVYNLTNVNGKWKYSRNISLTPTDSYFSLEAIGDNSDIMLLGIDSNVTVNLTINKTVNVTGNVTVGDSISYTIVITNNGQYGATGVSITDLLPAGLVFISSTTSQGSYNSATGLWTIGNITAGSSVTLTIIINVTGIGTIVNFANLTTLDQNNSGDNSTSVNITGIHSGSKDNNITAEINLTITKSSNATNATFGDSVTYTITVTNNDLSNATGVRVTDILDPRLIYLSNIASQGLYDPVTGLWIIGTLNGGTSVTLTITVRLNGIGTIGNTASIIADQNNTGNNDSTTNIIVVNITGDQNNTGNNSSNNTNNNSLNNTGNTNNNSNDPNNNFNSNNNDTDLGTEDDEVVLDDEVEELDNEDELYTDDEPSNVNKVAMKNTGVPIAALVVIFLLQALATGIVFKRKSFIMKK